MKSLSKKEVKMINNTEQEINKLLEAIVNKKEEFFKEHSIMPNAIEINAYMYALIMKHCGLINPLITKIDNNKYIIERPKMYDMELHISLLINKNEDINVYYVKEID